MKNADQSGQTISSSAPVSLDATNKRKLIYILSPSFSGSTLLTLMLAQHPGISTIGELKATAMGATDSYVCSCGEPIGDCSFWTKFSERCRAEGIPFSVEDFKTHFSSPSPWKRKVMGAQVRGPVFEAIRRLILSAPPLANVFQGLLERNARFMDLVCELQGGEAFMDGSKDPQRLLYFLHSEKWDVHVIRMFRDGRAQSNSRRQKPRNPVNFEGAAREWKRTIAQMEHVCSGLPSDRLHNLRYERLCEDPNEALADIWRFLDLQEIDQDWSNIDLKATAHHILGNKMRTKSSIQVALNRKWQEEMSPEEYTIFEAIAGDTNRDLGYGPLPVSACSPVPNPGLRSSGCGGTAQKKS